MTMAITAPVSVYELTHVSNDDLHASTRRIVARSNQLLAALLAHLAEVDARGIHRDRACSSLYTYCIYELRMSEDAAFRRARAAKIAQKFPILFDQIAAGEIHLTGLLMLGPHLTAENHRDLLSRAKHRTKKEIARLIRVIDPLPDVRALVEPLGPAPTLVPGNASWSQMVNALAPAVRELPPGDRPSDWSDSTPGNDVLDAEPEPEREREPEPDLPEPFDVPPQRYKVQFTASQKYVDLLETARDLLAHAVPSRSIEEVHLRAMRALVAELQKQKAGAKTKPPRQRGADREPAEPKPNPRRRGRYVPRKVRRAVWERDARRCTYVDPSGQRCRETGGLELDHVHPHARGGLPTIKSLRLRCRAHNALGAEEEFGREFVAWKRGGE
jgi:hypothetical protein